MRQYKGTFRANDSKIKTNPKTTTKGSDEADLENFTTCTDGVYSTFCAIRGHSMSRCSNYSSFDFKTAGCK